MAIARGSRESRRLQKVRKSARRAVNGFRELNKLGTEAVYGAESAAFGESGNACAVALCQAGRGRLREMGQVRGRRDSPQRWSGYGRRVACRGRTRQTLSSRSRPCSGLPGGSLGRARALL